MKKQKSIIALNSLNQSIKKNNTMLKKSDLNKLPQKYRVYGQNNDTIS